MPSPATDRPAPRERLLAAADQLFYEEGICTVGVDRILKHADVARASLYTTYGSKDELVRAYLQRRSDDWQATVAKVLPTKWDNARDRILGIFVLLTDWFAAPGYRGCPFINASAEAASGEALQEVRDRHRAWVRQLFAGLGREAGAKDPDALSAQLVLLYDGCMVGAQLDHSAAPGNAGQAAAAALITTAIGRRAAMAGIQPELWVEHASAAVEFYEEAFGATVLHRVGQGDDIVAQLAVGDDAFWVSAASSAMKRFSPRSISGATGRTLLIVDDPNAVVRRAVEAGAQELAAVADEHGWRLGQVVDPFGHEWEIGRPLGDWPPT